MLGTPPRPAMVSASVPSVAILPPATNCPSTVDPAPTRVSNTRAGTSETYLPHVVRHRVRVRGEQLVQIPRRDVQSRRDLGWCEGGLAVVLVDVVLDAEHQGSLRRVIAWPEVAELVGQQGKDEVPGACRRRLGDGARQDIAVSCQIQQETRRDPHERSVAVEPTGRQL